MAYIEINNVSIKGVSACVPKKVIENIDNPLFSKEEAEKTILRIGIERRRCVEGNVCTSDLCYEAAERLITDLKWNKNDVEALILVTQTPDYRNPATACILQNRLGLSTNCLAFDISLGCSGYVYGLSVISGLISSGKIKKALLLVGETASLMSSPEDQSRALLFGDAGTATALEYDETAENINFQLSTDGSGYQAIMTPDGGFRNRINSKSFEMEDFGDGIRRARIHSLLDGIEVFSFGITRAPQSVNQLCEKYSINKDEVDYFLFHQANLMMNEKIRKKLKLPEIKVPYHLKDFGNTSCASIPLLMVTNLSDKLNKQNLNVIICSFGVGLSWGSSYFSLKNIVCPNLIEI
jgi:3-oxoacyl-[acyl-carrier-protein] synthase III